MNDWNKTRQIRLAVGGAIVMGILGLPPIGHYESSFHVSTDTGLEAPSDADATVKKPKAAPTPDPKAPTEITCVKETTFDEKTRVAVFLGEVKVNDPQFKLSCDKLTAYLKKDNEAGP